MSHLVRLRTVSGRYLTVLQAFYSSAAAGGVVLLACTALAILWVNSPWAASYGALWNASYPVGAGGLSLDLTLREWVNDGLMAVFFYVVGVEIKHEVLFGNLATWRAASLPVAAAFGGMVVPAAIFSIVNLHGPGAAGWGIPMATDIAFALGILALLGTGLPEGLRLLLAAIAIVDDLGAVLVIAIFYAKDLSWPALAGAATVFAALLLLARFGVRHRLVYVLLGLVLWVFVLTSGIHSTIAGVLLAAAMPEGAPGTDGGAAARADRALTVIVAFAILPLFALANAGIPLGHGVATTARNPVALGVFAGLLIGKPLGIMAACVAMVRLRVGQLPTDVSWRHVHGAAWLAGIGFTMSLFVTGLAFTDAVHLDAAKLGVLGGSVSAGTIGYFLLRRERDT